MAMLTRDGPFANNVVNAAEDIFPGWVVQSPCSWSLSGYLGECAGSKEVSLHWIIVDYEIKNKDKRFPIFLHQVFLLS